MVVRLGAVLAAPLRADAVLTQWLKAGNHKSIESVCLDEIVDHRVGELNRLLAGIMINGGNSFILAHHSTPKIRAATGAVPVNDDPA